MEVRNLTTLPDAIFLKQSINAMIDAVFDKPAALPEGEVIHRAQAVNELVNALHIVKMIEATYSTGNTDAISTKSS